MQLGEAADMGLIDDGALPRHLRTAVAQPGEGGVDDHAFRHVRRAVALVEGGVVLGLELIGKQLRPPFQLAGMALGVGVEQKLVGLKRWPASGSHGPCTR